VEEGVLDVELVHRLAPRERQTEHGADGGVLHLGTESLIEVHARVLGEPPEFPTCLVAVKRTVSLKFMLEDLLAGDDVGPRSHVLLDNMASYSFSIARRQWGSASALRTEVGTTDSVREVTT
jgi:hypothetical protein